MENLYRRILDFLPSKSEIKKVINSFSKKESYLFVFLILVLIFSTLAILQRINKYFMVSVPMPGGSISEGIIGSPRFVNPVLARTNADLDLVSLIYSGLMRKGPNNVLIPDLAESYEVSKDGLNYTFVLKDKIYFQNNEPVTADDIIYTITQIKDPLNKSPRKASWDGVTVQKIDDKTILFQLRQPYASFLENTTIGIMPAELWQDSPIELNNLNTQPIGSGPFMVENISQESSGLINQYDLIPFKKFILGKPYLKDLILHFYANEEELTTGLLNGEVEQISSVSPEKAIGLKEKGYLIQSSVLPRVFGLFFNQNQNQIFTDKSVVGAINLAIDKNRIVSEVLGGYGVVIDDPIPPNMIAYQRITADQNLDQNSRLQKAINLLEKNGWKKGADGYLEKTTTDKKKKSTSTKLVFSIATGNSTDLVKTAEIIRENLTSLGIQVDVKTFETGNLNQTIIRPRQYDALLFGQVISHESDLYAFWHSSQRKDPGFNIAMYTNAKVDKLLEETLTISDPQTRIKKYALFEDEVKKDLPAVFLYSPDFVYVISNNLKGFSMDHISSPGDRFLNSYLWYTKTDQVWEIFSN